MAPQKEPYTEPVTLNLSGDEAKELTQLIDHSLESGFWADETATERLEWIQAKIADQVARQQVRSMKQDEGDYE